MSKVSIYNLVKREKKHSSHKRIKKYPFRKTHSRVQSRTTTAKYICRPPRSLMILPLIQIIHWQFNYKICSSNNTFINLQHLQIWPPNVAEKLPGHSIKFFAQTATFTKETLWFGWQTFYLQITIDIAWLHLEIQVIGCSKNSWLYM